jgi:copper chaperone
VVHRIGGMTCGGCAASVARAIERVGGQATVDLAAGTVRVHGPVSDDAVKRAIEAAGFEHLGVVA